MYRRLGLVGLGDALFNKYIINLAYGDHIQPRILAGIKNRIHGRLQGIIMTVGGADEFALLLTHVGPGNNPAYLPLILHGNLSGYLAAAIKLIQAEGLLISADLQN